MSEELENLENKSKWGGKREGSGRKKGSMNRSTIEEKTAKEEMRQRILTNLHELINSQLNIAKGASYLYRIDETKGNDGKTKREHVLVTDSDEIKDTLDGLDGCDSGVVDENYYYITTKTPDNKAIDSLFDRVFGKAVTKAEISGPDGGPIAVDDKVVALAKKYEEELKQHVTE